MLSAAQSSDDTSQRSFPGTLGNAPSAELFRPILLIRRRGPFLEIRFMIFFLSFLTLLDLLESVVLASLGACSKFDGASEVRLGTTFDAILDILLANFLFRLLFLPLETGTGSCSLSRLPSSSLNFLVSREMGFFKVLMGFFKVLIRGATIIAEERALVSMDIRGKKCWFNSASEADPPMSNTLSLSGLASKETSKKLPSSSKEETQPSVKMSKAGLGDPDAELS
mmetsp:Transcript_9219/g.21977  ORF Transcript_9219/g.21977 Transcript_9219/m.21977 type:complete len:225 (-) Transcript_9219:304-978(-)